MSANHKQVTLLDVAAASGVSYQTVSRVVNNHPHVSDTTRGRVLHHILELGYRPNKAARSLVTKRSSTIGIVSFGTAHYGPAQAVNNIERIARRRGYALIVTNLESMTFAALKQAVRDLVLQQVDGMVMIAPIRDVNLERVTALSGSTPFVMLDLDLGLDLPSIVIDQKGGARLAAEHLIGAGHRRIAEIHGPLDWVDAKLRHDGFLEALKLANLSPVGFAGGNWSARSGYDAMAHLFDERPSGVFVHNDQMALGAMRGARERGLSIPADLSFVGFDNIPEAAFFEPPLTTVEQDFKALGEQSVDYLIGLMGDGCPPPHQRVLYPKLVERQSVRRKGA